MTAIQRTRYNRLAKAKQRGSKKSYVTQFEDAKIILAWEAENLTEGQAAKALQMDRVSMRILREELINAGGSLARELRPAPPA